MRPAAGASRGDNVHPVVAIHVSGRNAHPAGERFAVRVEAADLALHLLARAAIEDAHVRAAAGSWAGNDVGVTIAIDIARRNVDPPVKDSL